MTMATQAPQFTPEDGRDIALRLNMGLAQRKALRSAKAPSMAELFPGTAPGRTYQDVLAASRKPESVRLAWTDHLENAAPYGPYVEMPAVSEALLDAIRDHESGRMRGRVPKDDFMKPILDLHPDWPRGALLGDRKRIRGADGKTRTAPDDGRPESYNAWGAYQLHKGPVDDVNRIYGTDYSYLDRLDPRKSRQVAGLYMQHWGPRPIRSNGVVVARPKPSQETYARTYNGGPRGLANPRTWRYWQQVKGHLKGRAIE